MQQIVMSFEASTIERREWKGHFRAIYVDLLCYVN